MTSWDNQGFASSCTASSIENSEQHIKISPNLGLVVRCSSTLNIKQQIYNYVPQEACSHTRKCASIFQKEFKKNCTFSRGLHRHSQHLYMFLVTYHLSTFVFRSTLISSFFRNCNVDLKVYGLYRNILGYLCDLIDQPF